MLRPFPPKAPVHFNTGAWALAVVADERWVERGALLSDAGDYGCVSQKLGVLSLPLHSFGNKLLFWPRRLLWARAVAALAGKLWEGGGSALAARGRGHRRRAKDEQETAARVRLRSARPALPHPPLTGGGPCSHPTPTPGSPPTPQLRAYSRGLKGDGERRLDPPHSPLARTHAQKVRKFFAESDVYLFSVFAT